MTEAITQEMLIKDGGSLRKLPTGDQGRGVPAWKVVLFYCRNWTPQVTGDLAGVVAEDVRADLAEEWRSVIAENSSVKTAFPKAPTLEFFSLLTTEAAAQAECNRRLGLYSQARLRFVVKVFRTKVPADTDLGQERTLRYPRFGLDEGKNFRIIGIKDRLGSDVIDLDMWG